MEHSFEHGYALVIGVGECAYTPWSLPVTVKDANALHAVLTHPHRCAYIADEAHVRLLTDHKATRDAILAGLTWLRFCAVQDAAATVIIYFSGHGCSDRTNGRFFLLPHDVAPYDIPGTALAAEEFTQALHAIPAARLLVIVDACHASGMAVAKEGVTTPPPVRFPGGFQSDALPPHSFADLARGMGRAVFTSSRAGQQSFVRPDGALSIYTWRLIEALQGGACAPGETTIRLSHLMNHLARWTPTDAQCFYHVEQTPFFDTATEDFPIALVWGGVGVRGDEPPEAFQPGGGVIYSAAVTGAGAAAQDHSAAAGQHGIAILGDHNRVTRLHQEVHGDLYMFEPQEKAAAATRLTYLRTFITKHSRLTMRGVSWDSSNPANERAQPTLDQIFVMLDTTAFVEGSEAGPHPDELMGLEIAAAAHEVTHPRLLSVLEAIVQNQHVVLLGDPGAGKSTVLSYIGLTLALHQAEPEGGWLAHLPGWPSGQTDLLPVHVVLRDFARRMKSVRDGEQPQRLWGFIMNQLYEVNLGDAEGLLRTALEEGSALVMLDGLDEISNVRQLDFVRKAITSFVERYPRCRVLITCRTLTYQNWEWRLPGIPFFTIAPLSDVQIDHFIARWYAELARIGIISRSDARDLVVKLREAVARADLHSLATNPLLLTVMALVHTHKGRLPDARSLLYEETVDLMLLHWEEIKNPSVGEGARLRQLLREANRTDVDLKRTLWQLAYQSHAAGAAAPDDAGLSDIHEYTLERALSGLHPQQSRDWAAAVIQTIKLRSGLLLERAPEVYAFPHRTFQEYLAGAHLASQSDFALQAARLSVSNDYWFQVILLATGRLVHVAGDVDKPLSLAAELCPHREPQNAAQWRRVRLAAEVLQEMGLNRMGDRALGVELAERVRRRLALGIRLPELSPVERAAASQLLVNFGDPRFDPDWLFLPSDSMLGFVFVPAGPFIMGAPPHEHTVELPGFLIGRYPVTTAQFRAFLLDAGLHAHASQAASAADNCPVAGVSWLQALEYCNWLTKRLQQSTPKSSRLLEFLMREGGGKYWRASLPSEAEWEKAGRGGLFIPRSPGMMEGQEGDMIANPMPKRTYPWGDEPQGERANIDAAGVGAVCGVGCFGEGASPYGIEDLCGNVWEWTRTAWGGNVAVRDFGWPYERDDGRERSTLPANVFRVLKGGAFYNSLAQTSCAAADRNYPDLALNHVGFRVVLLPSE
jgi:formylglycine-generating enzyme required for sulfatase activity